VAWRFERRSSVRVLVIGGTKFIGLALVRRLVSLGHEVAVFHRGQSPAELPPSVVELKGDRHRLGGHAAQFRWIMPEVVVDMIAFTASDARGLVDAFRGQARRAVVISSADVYRAYGIFLGLEAGPLEPTPLAEDAPLRSILYPYRSHSSGADDFLHDYDKIPVEQVILGQSDLPATVLRLPIVHGPGDEHHRLAAYLRRMDQGRPAILLNESMAHWKCPRGFVENVAQAIVLAVTNEAAAGRVHNVAEPIALTEAEWIGKIGEAVGWKGDVVAVPRDRVPIPFDARQSLDTDSTRIRRELGYEEAVPLEQGLRTTIDWERSGAGSDGSGVGLVDYAAEDAILAEMGRA
jgi:nucleoside-diphosphate-sugar epimerase